MEVFLPHFLQSMLNRIAFRAVEKRNVSTIFHSEITEWIYYGLAFGQISLKSTRWRSLGYFSGKTVHQITVYRKQNREDTYAINRSDRPISTSVFSDNLVQNHGTKCLWQPSIVSGY